MRTEITVLILTDGRFEIEQGQGISDEQIMCYAEDVGLAQPVIDSGYMRFYGEPEKIYKFFYCLTEDYITVKLT